MEMESVNEDGPGSNKVSRPCGDLRVGMWKRANYHCCWWSIIVGLGNLQLVIYHFHFCGIKTFRQIATSPKGLLAMTTSHQ